RRIEIVVMEFRNLHDPLAQLQVAVKCAEVAADSFHELGIHRYWNVGLVERSFKSCLVISRTRVEDRGLHVGIHQRSEGGAILRERGEEGLHDLLPGFANGGSAGERER